jgi:hypothetical protein
MDVRADVPPSPPLSLSPPPSPSLLSAVRADAKNKIKIKLNNLFIFKLINFFGSYCRLGKREFFYNLQFSIFGPQNPQTPRAPRASRAKPREEEGFFDLVPLVTHPSSTPLFGGLTPKFLSLSLHSL